MTIEIQHYKCPTCGHLMGQDEYEHACDRIFEEIEKSTKQALEKMNLKHQEDIRKIEERHMLEVEDKISQQVQSQRKQIEYEYDEKLRHENAVILAVHEQEITKKDKEIEEVKSQNARDIEEKIQQAITYTEKKNMQQVTEYKLKLDRIESDNKDLVTKTEQMQKTLDSIPPELRGTAGEVVLHDILSKEFPRDVFVAKIVGVGMADVIQTIVTKNGEQIAPPIAWDKKTGDNVTPKDIEKSKGYKTKHNTDYSIIVVTKPTKKVIERKEGILIVHQSIVVEVARIIREFIIQTAKHTGRNNGRTSKQAKLFDYITSPEYFRTMEAIKDKKSDLDELQRKEEEYHQKTWTTRKKLVEKWFDTDKHNQDIIDGIVDDQNIEKTNDDTEDAEDEGNPSSSQ